jgi:methionyl-tRNA formyltransferase
MKKYLLLINGQLGLKILKYILDQPEVRLLAVVLNSNERRTKEYLQDVKVMLTKSETLIFKYEPSEKIQEDLKNCISNADFIVSAMFGHKIPPELLLLVKRSIINLHPSMLPLGRGAHPIPWAIINKSQQGISIHNIDENLDTGNILFQKELRVNISMNAGQIYEQAINELFFEFKRLRLDWESEKLIPYRQKSANIKKINSKDLELIRIFQENENGEFGDFLRRIQALTFSDGRVPIYNDLDGKLWKIHLELQPIEKEL